MESKITTIIFDWGGVLSGMTDMRDFAKEFAREKNVDPGMLETTMMDAWQQAKVGKISSEEFYAVIAEKTKANHEDIHQSFLSFFGSNLESIELARSLKKKYKVALLTNNIGAWVESALLEHQLTDFFDVVISSHSSQKAKPDPEIYHEVVHALGVTTSECVFIDDKQKNVDTANNLGMYGITFTSATQLRRDLEKLGVTTN
jgi:putative hydrolase of the HAD superfamily